MEASFGREKIGKKILIFLPEELNFDTIFEIFVSGNWKCTFQIKPW